ncbi:hypothetical protein CONPUDRAFT_67345 [Coniophora puteana RWD-64-598 SS2]|uniref:Exocyst complex protein EXO70 n=1 Tax=Coniophora puteana (strain RWD-64-598) TaxID=741705 RepID=R7SH91_CONPW|nr:uncharacterized protein CONPUDRAFT_67345 [Coniophora puteana RWD-64-598 SS2]EIW74439.1 hypothetical protein CONPUDRAFT_67345 [Coniophora puteana RWD-64-598 SS2]
MDDDGAEIELLEQNMNKTRQISRRMSSILTTFESRLVKLEKSVLPLYTSTQKLNLRAHNIDRALLKIDELASSQEGIAEEEGLILRGPQPGQLDTYITTLEKLNASIAFKSASDSRDAATLVQSGANKLASLYTKLVAEASSGSPSTVASTAFPPNILSILTPLVAALRSLPLPSTHPSHPAASAIRSALASAQTGYADMRGSWHRRALSGPAKRLVDRAENVDGVAMGKEFSDWLDRLLSAAESEHASLISLAPLPTPSLIAQAYTTLLTPLFQLFTETINSLNNIVRRNLHKHAFLALGLYTSLQDSSLYSRWERIATRREDSSTSGSTSTANMGADARGGGGTLPSEHKDAMNSVRAVCLRSFPELLADIKMAGAPTAPTAKSGADKGLDIGTSTVNYLAKIPSVHSAVGSALVALGDGNWKMGAASKVGKSTFGEGDEAVLVQHFVFDVVKELITTINSLSKQHRKPASGSIFLLNNITYLRSRLLSVPQHTTSPLNGATTVLDTMSQPSRDALSSAWRTAKAGYLDSHLASLLGAFSEASSASAGKAAAKEAFVKFYEALEEVLERHKGVRVLGDVIDGDGKGGTWDEGTERGALEDEVIRLVVPALRAFVQKQKDREFSKNPQKYIKFSPEEVENQLRGLYNR